MLVSELTLDETRGRRLYIATAVLRIGGETRPCERMDEAVPGLRAAMRRRWDGGAGAQIEVGGRIAEGDTVSWED